MMRIILTKQIILFASIILVVCASKDVTSSADNSIAADKNQYEIVPDNIAAESIDISTKLKRGASTNDSQNQSSQGTTASTSSSTAGVISYSTPNSYQQFYSPNFAQLGQFYAAAIPATATAAASSPTQIFYVRAPQQITPSGVGTIKLTYTPNQSQPQSIIQYAATQPKIIYSSPPAQAYTQIAYANQPGSPAINYVNQPGSPAITYGNQPGSPAITYANQPGSPAITYSNQPAASTVTYASQPAASTVTYANQPATSTFGYSPSVGFSYNPNVYSTQSQHASLYQGQIIPYPYTTSTSGNNVVLAPAQIQQISYNPQPAAAAYAPITAPYPTHSPYASKVGSVVTPTAAAYYATPVGQSYHQQPAFLTAPSIQYATAQKLVAVPAYQQQYSAYKVSPTVSSAAANGYTAAFVQPTAISPVKYVSQAQSQPAYYGSPSTVYTQKLAYAPTNIAGAASVPHTYYSAVPYNSQQVSSSNGAIHYGTHLFQPASAKYGYTQINSPQKYY